MSPAAVMQSTVNQAKRIPLLRRAPADTGSDGTGQHARAWAVADDGPDRSTKAGRRFGATFPRLSIETVAYRRQEQVPAGTGLANGGMIPYVCGASCFLTARAMEQVKVDLCYSNANVKLCGMSPGMAYGQLGPTHHSIEDLAWDADSAQPCSDRAGRSGGDLRRRCVLPSWNMRGRCTCASPACQFAPCTRIITLLQVGQGCGASRRERRHADGKRSDGLAGAGCREYSGGGRNPSMSVLNMSSMKPMDVDAVLDAARTTRGIVTAEEALAAWGLGGAAAVSSRCITPRQMRILGVPGVFRTQGVGRVSVGTLRRGRRKAFTMRLSTCWGRRSKWRRGSSWPLTRARPIPRPCSSMPTGGPVFCVSWLFFLIHSVGQGFVEQDPMLLVDSGVKATAERLLHAGATGVAIEAIAISNQRETVVVWDASTGKTQCCQLANADAGAGFGHRLAPLATQFRNRTGLPLAPLVSAGKWAWLLENDATVQSLAS